MLVQTHFQNTQNAPIEETELNYPVRILRYSLIPDSEGPGRWRGGLGICREYAFVNHDAVFTMLADRAKFPALGLFEGEEGKTSRYQLVSNGRITRIPSKGTIRVTPRDMIRVESPGGGGYGPPRQRDAELVLEDVQQGKVSSIRARERYGVAIDTIRWVVDEEETRELRNHSP